MDIAGWYLETDRQQKSKIQPEYVFTDEKERQEYLQHLLIDYGLLAEKIIIIFVEGETEYNVLKEYFSIFRYLPHFDKIDVQNIGGETNASFTFSYIIKNFRVKYHFLFLDYDDDDSYNNKKKKLIRERIPENSYHFSQPDFVTENFTPEEIMKAYRNYLNKIEMTLTEENLEELEKNLIYAKENNMSYEKTIDNFQYQFYDEEIFPDFSKPEFAKHLASIVNEGSQKLIDRIEGGKLFPFREALQSFFKQFDKTRRKWFRRKGYRVLD